MKKKNHKSFKDLLQSLSPLKNLFDEIRLPYEFDLMWDIKDPHQLISYLIFHPCNIDVFKCLARHGYDSKKISSFILENYQSLMNDLETGVFYDKIYPI